MSERKQHGALAPRCGCGLVDRWGNSTPCREHYTGRNPNPVFPANLSRTPLAVPAPLASARPSGTKLCAACGRVKPLGLFGQDADWFGNLTRRESCLRCEQVGVERVLALREFLLGGEVKS